MSIINLGNVGDLQKPVTLIASKIFEATGIYFKPWTSKRIANADADALLIKSKAEQQSLTIEQRARHRRENEEIIYQTNIENIMRKAIPDLNEDATPQDMDNDWIANFFEKCRIISDENMQTLWGSILAGEANSPGSFSKRTVNFVASLKKDEAELFRKLCGFLVQIKVPAPIVFDVHDLIYSKFQITFENLTHLDEIGLINFNAITGYHFQAHGRQGCIHYYGIPIVLEFPNFEDGKIDGGKVLLTEIGQELARICDAEQVSGFLDYFLARLYKDNIITSSPYPKEF